MTPTILDLLLRGWTTHPVTGLAVTRNSGSAGNWVQLGDGATPATYPAQLGRAQTVNGGMSFNGSQYLQWMSPVASGTYTLCALAQKTALGDYYLLDARTGGGAGYIAVAGGSVFATSGTVSVNGEATAVVPYGQVCLIAVSGITIAASTKIVLGASTVLTQPWVGNQYGISVYPGALTPTQLRDVRDRLMARMAGP